MHFLFSGVFNFTNSSSFGLILRLTGVQTKNKGITQEWVNPLGLNRITVSELAGEYKVETTGFSIILTGNIKLGEEHKDQIIISILLQLLNGTMPTAFVGKLEHSDKEEIPLSQIINSFFDVALIIRWPDGLVTYTAPWLDEIKVRNLELYFIPGPESITSPWDPSITFPPGLATSLDVSFFGYPSQVHAVAKGINSSNILISGRINNIIDFCDGIVQIESSLNDAKGPSFSFIKNEEENYSFSMDIGVKILNLPKRSINLKNIEKQDYFSFIVNTDELAVFKLNALCKLTRNNHFSISAEAFTDLNDEYNLTFMGNKIFKVAIQGQIVINFVMDLTKEQSLLNYSARWWTISVEGKSEERISNFKRIAELVIENVLSQLKDISVEKVLELFDTNFIFFFNPLGFILSEFGITPEKAIELLRGLKKYEGKQQEIVNALVVPGGYTADAVKKVFDQAGLTIPELKWPPVRIDPGSIIDPGRFL
ncbi:hypothetical protein HMSSN036_67490 [Paenibacillus macerans]|nr:hypothetical protein HMSSN036_67490 [Paenibacillus macerans]